MSARRDRLVFYRAADGHRWKFVASNGRVLADGGQGYSRRADAVKCAERVTGRVVDGPKAFTGPRYLSIDVVVEP